MISSVVGVALLISLSLSNADSSTEITDGNKRLDAIRLLEKLAETRRGLIYLKALLSEADNELQNSGNSKEALAERQSVELLLDLLSDLDTNVKLKQKRTCKVNLGGHCSTENAVEMADQWNFLNSQFSPGRRRRQPRLTKRTIFGAK